ncbi:hypothetical protein BofuT4_uP047260.1 [Botrytis cinerea T4]|uniref:Uncharacterized protein n=1 Tax=Botryotinia fuckeliana (strain T4) TaxID=999810 RepID=G2XZ21_BOTF4|nr:hypothetical protein BofuT4_uP047260.1 [Botrytis cinerea T4]
MHDLSIGSTLGRYTILDPHPHLQHPRSKIPKFLPRYKRKEGRDQSKDILRVEIRDLVNMWGIPEAKGSRE